MKRLTKFEELALEWLREAWEKYPEPLLTVHSAYGLQRRSYGTPYSRGVEFWMKVLEKLKAKGLTERDSIKPVIWRLKELRKEGEN